jgi:integrase
MTARATPSTITRSRIEAAMRAVDKGAEASVNLRDPRMPGLSLTIGRRSARWAYGYKAPLPGGGWSGGKRLVLGDLAAMDLDAAREAALAARTQVASGIDPVAAKRARRAANIDAATSRTVAAAIERFTEERSADWTASTRAAFRRDFAIIREAVGDAPLALVDRPRLAALITDYLEKLRARDRAGIRQATRIAGLLGALWRQASVGSPRYAGWAWPGVDALVAARLPVPGRHRMVEAEIRDLWPALRAPGLCQPHRLVLALSLVTGARIGAIALLDERDLDLDPEPVVGARDSGPTFTIRAAEGRKATARDRREGADVVLPLAPLAVELFREALAIRRGGGPRVFEQRGGKPLASGGVTRQWAALAGLGLAPPAATAHDLRRSMRSHLGEIDHGGDWADEERLLGHKLGGAVAQTYDRGRRLARLRPLANAWGKRLEAIVSAPPAGVAPLRGRA